MSVWKKVRLLCVGFYWFFTNLDFVCCTCPDTNGNHLLVSALNYQPLVGNMTKERNWPQFFRHRVGQCVGRFYRVFTSYWNPDHRQLLETDYKNRFHTTSPTESRIKNFPLSRQGQKVQEVPTIKSIYSGRTRFPSGVFFSHVFLQTFISPRFMPMTSLAKVLCPSPRQKKFQPRCHGRVSWPVWFNISEPPLVQQVVQLWASVLQARNEGSARQYLPCDPQLGHWTLRFSSLGLLTSFSNGTVTKWRP